MAVSEEVARARVRVRHLDLLLVSLVSPELNVLKKTVQILNITYHRKGGKGGGERLVCYMLICVKIELARA